MAWISVVWGLAIEDPEEGVAGDDPRVDEASLQIFFVTAFNGRVKVHGYTTGDVYPTFELPALDSPSGWANPQARTARGVISSKNVPTNNNPFFGLVIRTVEEDRSLHRHRRDNNNILYETVRVAAQTAFDDGRTPTREELAVAARVASSKMHDRLFRDDDDFIGEAAWIYPNLGVDWWPNSSTDESGLRPGQTIYYERELNRLTSRRENANYRIYQQVFITANNPSGPRLIDDRIENE
ncbi:hypothetical protein [Psychrobacter sp. ASPA161_9]|uniref:hypothetical protein n=1 Tax=Psychrobacter sp. ASPA161_9 TaxID=3160961 RepID=UPI003F7E0428